MEQQCKQFYPGCCRPTSNKQRPSMWEDFMKGKSLPPGKEYKINNNISPNRKNFSPSVAKQGQAYSYSGSSLMAYAMPLGGLGTGTIAMAGDGGLRQWQILNEVCHLAHIPDSFFAIKSEDSSGNSNSYVLQSAENYNQSNFTPAPLISDHVIPQDSINLLQTLPGVPSLTMTGKYPITTVQYNIPNFPLNVQMECYNPLIPLDAKNSALPAIFFNFTVTNTSSVSQTATLMMAQQNFVGWDGYSAISGVNFGGYGGNVNSFASSETISYIEMVSNSITNQQLNGNVGIALLNNGETVSDILDWTDLNALWQAFNTGNYSNKKMSDPSPSGSTYNSSLLGSFTVAPQSSHTFTFVLSWYFPNRYVNWGQPYSIADGISALYLGNQYANFWNDVVDVFNYISANFSMLQNTTRAFVNTFYGSTLPWQILDSAGGRISVCRSVTCFWNALDNRFHAFEGCLGASTGGFDLVGGCCPMDCTHVWNYAFTLSRMFPALEQSMRETDLIDRMSPYGYVPERSVLPSGEMKQEWIQWPNFRSGSVCVDGEFGTVVKTYREVLQSGDLNWLANLWPKIKLLMSHFFNDYDTDGDGVIKGPQFNTYDCTITGANTFIGTLYLCALRAAEEMAILMNDETAQQMYRTRFEIGSLNLDKYCWSEECQYYVNVGYDPDGYNAIGNGSFVDALHGQWWAHSLNLGHLLPQEHVQASINSLFQFNHQVGFDPAKESPRAFMDERDSGLWVCRWPYGNEPGNAILYNSECWSGIEYPNASLFFYERLPKNGLTIVSDIRARQDGTRRSPWNEVECGDHYSRPQGSWLVFESAAGLHYNAVAQSIEFSPLFTPSNFASFFSTASGWGNYSQVGTSNFATGTATFTVQWGVVTLQQVTLTTSSSNVSVTLNGTNVPAKAVNNNGKTTVVFNSPVTAQTGQTLQITLS